MESYYVSDLKEIHKHCLTTVTPLFDWSKMSMFDDPASCCSGTTWSAVQLPTPQTWHIFA